MTDPFAESGDMWSDGYAVNVTGIHGDGFPEVQIRFSAP
jgi:hypothetical protein